MSLVDVPDKASLVFSLTIPATIARMEKAGYNEVEIARELNLPFHMVVLIKKGYKLNKKILFMHLVDFYKRVSSMASMKGKKTEVARFLAGFPISYEKKIRLLLGEVSDAPYGVAESTILEALRIANNQTPAYMDRLFHEYGEIGEIAQLLAREKEPELLLDEVYYTLREIPSLGRYHSILAIASLFEKASKEEAKYLSRLLRRNLYIHLQAHVVAVAVSEMFKLDADLLTQAMLIRGRIHGLLLAKLGNKALRKVRLVPGRFIAPMLCYTFHRNRISYPSLVQVKLDGVRCQIHKIGDKVHIYSRTGKLLDDDYPDALDTSTVRSPRACILDGEIIGLKDGKILPLYEALRQKEEARFEARVFDVLYHRKSLLGEPLSSRLKTLLEILEPEIIVHGTICNSYEDVMKHYDKIVEQGFEGIVVKDLSSKYYPGRRHRSWLKLKRTRDTLDAVIVKAKYGYGKLGGIFTSFTLAVRHESKPVLYPIGDSTGMDQETLSILTEKLRPLMTGIRDKEGVFVKPRIVVETVFHEVIRSKEFPSGYALRNPSILRIRDDKTVRDINTINDVVEAYKKHTGI